MDIFRFTGGAWTRTRLPHGPSAHTGQSVTLSEDGYTLVVGTNDTPVDPVCKTPVERRGAAGRLRYRGTEFWFCSLTCAAAFASNPGWHAIESLRPRSR